MVDIKQPFVSNIHTAMTAVVSLALFGTFLIAVIRVAFPFWKRIVDRRENPPDTGLEVIGPLESSTQNHETVVDDPDALNIKFE